MEEPIYGIPPDTVVDDVVFAAAPSNPWHLPKDIWTKIWSRATGKGIKVAVLDTGYTKHVDGPEPIATKSFISGQSVIDGNGHGTHCAGTVLGRNGIGVAPEAELIVGKVLSNQGSGGSTGIAAGIRWAVDAGADVISMSLGGGGSDAGTNASIDYAISRGVIVNAAAGNAGYNGANTIGWPARYKNCLCNAAYRSDGSIAGFSSGGAEIDWATPGQDILSFAANGSGFVSMSGTSMATPFGSGLLALIIELMRREGAVAWSGPDAVREFFKRYCEDRGAPGHDPRFGHGVPRSSEIVAALVNDDLQYA